MGLALGALLLAGCLAETGAPTPATSTSTADVDPPAPSLAPQPERSAPATIPLHVGRATTVSSGSEPSILADAAGKLVWIGDTSGGYWSNNNGTSWNRMGNYAGGAQFAFNDGWALAQDGAGHLFVGVLRDNRIDVARSSDGGQIFDQVGYAAGVSGSADRPWIAAKPDGTVGLFYFDAPTVIFGFSEHCARSTDGGLTFVDRDPAAVLPGTGGSVHYDSKGRLYFSSNDGSLYRFDTTCVAGGRAIPMGSDLGINNMIKSAVDGTDLYMAAATGNSRAITLFGSQDGGPVRRIVVSPPELASNTYAAVAARDGKVAVAWYGSTTAGDPSAASFTGDFHTYVTVVDGFWTTPRLTTTRISNSPNHHGQICMGGVTCGLDGTDTRGLLDYLGIDIDIWGGIHVAFVDDMSGSASTLYTRIPPAPPPQAPVGSLPPSADFTVRVQDRTASVDASPSRSPSGSLLTFRWQWGDGATGQGVKASHEYQEFGTYDIQLTATDTQGRTGTHTTRIRVDGRSVGPPQVAWDYEPAEPGAGQKVTFTDRSLSMDGTTLVAWAWDFGDGATATTATAEHAFEEMGTYTVSLRVRDDRGAEDSMARDIVVGERGNETEQPTTTDQETRGSNGLGGALAVAALVGAVAWAARRR